MGEECEQQDGHLQPEAAVSSIGHSELRPWTETFSHMDPFDMKEEFAPSEKALIGKRQQAAHNLIAPHLRILQFLTSHFNSSRLGSPHTQRIFHRLIVLTLNGLKHSAMHPLAREFHFQFILFSLNYLRSCTGFDQAARWRLKDAILSAGLSWFTRPPQYDTRICAMRLTQLT